MARHRHRKKTQPKQTIQQSTQQTIKNRDRLTVARRLRRVFDFPPQDDRRIPLINSEDFYGRPIDRTYHTPAGKPIDTVQLPVNHNRPTLNQDNFLRSPTRTVFSDNRVSVCQRRQERRQVLFAKNKTGKGARKREHVFTALSRVICKKH